ncbi:MAG: DUF397 domain-containing protein [Nocardiopsaceae bacterium]|nr:DUF397 domain-containing protein [Nocardiopsaceae bacterium]
MEEAEMTSAEWRKSSFSGSNGNCVEVAAWRKSSFSGSNGNCVEMAADGSVVAVRDNKDPEGARLTFEPAVWRAFAETLKRGA